MNCLIEDPSLDYFKHITTFFKISKKKITKKKEKKNIQNTIQIQNNYIQTKNHLFKRTVQNITLQLDENTVKLTIMSTEIPKNQLDDSFRNYLITSNTELGKKKAFKI